MSDTPQLMIEELAGQKRTIVLAGRALPLKSSGIGFGVKQRSKTTFYQGNPIGSRQVFGASFSDMDLSGIWSDRWLTSTTPQGQIVQPEAVAEVNGFQVAALSDLDTLFEQIATSGVEIQLTWAHKTRIGTLKQYEPTWRTIHDLEWKMTFEWLSAGQTDTTVNLFLSTPTDEAAKWSAISDALTTTVPAGGLAILQSAVGDIQDALANVVAAIQSYASQVTQYAAAVLSPVEIITALASTLQAIANTAQTLLNTLTAQVYCAIVTSPEETIEAVQTLTDADLYNAPKNTLPQVQSVGQGIATAEWLRQFKSEAKNARDEAIQERQERIAQYGSGGLQDIYLAKQGEDLRDVSTAEYGTPDQWQLLRTYNGLTGSALSAGQVVLVPDLASIGAL